MIIFQIKGRKTSEEDNLYSLSMKEPKLSKQKKITFNIKPEIIKKEEKKDNENLLFSVPKDKKGELNYKSSLTTEPIFGFRKEDKKENENSLFSVPKDKKGELNYKSILTTESIFGFKNEDKKVNENSLFSVSKDKKDNTSSTTQIFSSPPPILNNEKEEKMKIDITSIPVSSTIDTNKQTDMRLFKSNNNFSLLNEKNPFIMKATNVKIEQKFTVPGNSFFENSIISENKETKISFKNDNLDEKKEENNDNNKSIFNINYQNNNSIFAKNVVDKNNNNISIFNTDNNQVGTIFGGVNNPLIGDLHKKN